MSEAVATRRKSLLEHFSAIKDNRQPCKVMYPLGEVLLLVVCGTMAACDDYDDIVLWGNRHLDFLRRLQPYHFGIPCADWLRVVMNRVGPELFASCFLAFVAERLPEAVGQIAIDGKTSRRSHDRGRGQAALHLVSAYATTHSLVLGQLAVADKSNEITAIPLLLKDLAASGALAGSLVSIDAMGCQSDIAETIVDLGGDYLLATKDNQKTAHAEIQLYFDAAPAEEIDALTEVDKAHGRIETRRHLVSQRVDWMSGKRRYPDEPRFKGLSTIAMVETRIETGAQVRVERRCYISLSHPHRENLRRGRQSPLGHRERAALGSRCSVQGGPIPPAPRPRRHKHGDGPSPRPQPHPRHARQTIHQGKAKTRNLGYRLPHGRPQSALTWTRCPASMGTGLARLPVFRTDRRALPRRGSGAGAGPSRPDGRGRACPPRAAARRAPRAEPGRAANRQRGRPRRAASPCLRRA